MPLRPPALAIQMVIVIAGPALLPASARGQSPTAESTPPVIDDAAHHATYITHRIVPGKPDDVRQWLEGKQIIAFFPKSEKIPSVTKVDVLTPKWFEPGGRRRATLNDGSTVEERVIAYDATKFRYQIWGFTSSARFTVSYIVGEFSYAAETPALTRVTWAYKIRPKWSLLSWPVDSFLSGTFAPHMELTMTNMAQARAKMAGQ
jgi:Polyketide cyclase / dehydrase and lipid transport